MEVSRKHLHNARNQRLTKCGWYMQTMHLLLCRRAPTGFYRLHGDIEAHGGFQCTSEAMEGDHDIINIMQELIQPGGQAADPYYGRNKQKRTYTANAIQ